MRSALDQTYPSVEVIVVNDGSTDDTEKALAPYRSRILYFSQPNRGPSAARNRAVGAARGEYIALLDADDYWLPERLERMVDLMDSRPEIGFATSDAYIVRAGRAVRDTWYGLNRLPKHWRTKQAFSIVQHNFVFTGTVIRRRLFEKHGNFDERLRTGEDWELWIRFISRGERLEVLDSPLAFYRRRDDSLSAVPLDEQGRASLVIERALERPEVQRIPGAIGLFSYVRGVESLAGNDATAVRREFATALRDPGLPLFRRFKARIGATSPELAIRLFRTWRQLRGP